MPSEINTTLRPPSIPRDHYDIEEGYMIVQLGVTTTQRYEPNAERALAAVADRLDMVLQPCLRVRSKRR